MVKTFEEFKKYIFGYRNLRLFYKKLDTMINRCERDKPALDALLINEGAEGCIAGDTLIQIIKGIGTRTYTLEELYNCFNGIPNKYGKLQFHKDVPSFVRSYNNKDISLHKINDVVFSGVKKVYKLILENGLSIKATADHKFLTNNNEWIELLNLKEDEEIMCYTLDTTKGIPKFSQPISIEYVGEEKTYDIQCEEPYHNFVANGIVVHNSGKTNASILEAGFIRAVTGREIHLFFRLKAMMEFAQTHEGKIIIWDEPALDSLSSDAITTMNKDMLRLFMAIRKKRHFFIVNFTKFWKFPEYITNERALGMFRTYSLKEIENGRFLYIKKGKLERLRQDYDKNKKKNYRKYSSFHGVFPEIMDDYFDGMDIFVNNKQHCTLNDYNSEKDKAIEAIGHKESSMTKKEMQLWKRLNGMRIRFTMIKGISQQELAKMVGINRREFVEWAHIPLSDSDLLGKPKFEGYQGSHNMTS